MNITDREKSRESRVGQAVVKKIISPAEPVNEVIVDDPEEIKEVVEQAVEQKKKGRPFTNREVKKKFSVTLLPSLYNAASSKAYADGHSISEVIGNFLSEYVKSNQK